MGVSENTLHALAADFSRKVVTVQTEKGLRRPVKYLDYPDQDPNAMMEFAEGYFKPVDTDNTEQREAMLEHIRQLWENNPELIISFVVQDSLLNIGKVGYHLKLMIGSMFSITRENAQFGYSAVDDGQKLETDITTLVFRQSQ